MRIRLFFICGLAIAFFGSCTKGPEQKVTDYTPLISSVEGNVVSGELGLWNPTGILVRCGNRVITLDSSGNFFFKDISLDAKVATVTVVKNGNTIMTKSFVPNDHHNYVRIEIWDFISTGRIVSTASDYNTGIEYGNIFNAQIPSGSFSGSSFTLKYKEVSPANEVAWDVVYGRVPGNFIAEDIQGNINGLQVMSKFFYLGAENSSGTALPLINGKTITITKYDNFETGDAPYFLYFLDQQKGTWKKIGEASYSATTKKFTAISDSINGFFVIAHPFEVVKFTGKLIASNGFPVYSLVRINKVGEKNYSYITYSNNKGEITGYLPKSVNIELSLLQSNPGGYYAYKLTELIFNKTLGSIGNDIDLGSITCFNMGDTAKRALLTYRGRVVDCNNNPVSGVIIADGSLLSDKFPVTVSSTNGEFAVNYTRGESFMMGYSLVFYNPADNQKSQVLYPMTLQKDLKLTSYDLGTITICNSNTSEFMTFTVDGQAIDYRPPATLLQYYSPSVGIVDPTATLNEYIKSTNGNAFDVGFYGNFGLGSKKLSSLTVGFANIIQWLNAPVYFNITENRNSGSFYVAGSFQNLQVKYADGTTHRIDCNFRVRN
ncbi:MAG TPA: hypothetical protein VKB95_15150 [Chitinophagaceae bacterium]|nr:hypothetical protein [Chitinophagaceae bacterium]